MTEKKIFEELLKRYNFASKKNEMDKFICGIDEYKLIIKDDYDTEHTSSHRTYKFFYNLNEMNKGINLSEYLNKQLIYMLNSNNIENTLGVLRFISSHLWDLKEKKEVLNLDLKPILELLKIKLVEQKDEMSKNKDGMYGCLKNGMYGVAENVAFDCELYGHKIL